MADLVSPDQIRSRSFRTTFRGFDQAEVAEFLDRVSRTVEYLDRERARVGSEVDEQTDGDLQTEFQRVSAEIGEVLEGARLAAEGMRDRAAAEAADWRRSAEEDSAKAREEAQSDSEALRGDAWSTAKAMLDQSQAEARDIGEAAEKDALAVVGHSERESHKKLASARRESDEMVRTAKMESERLLVNARSQHDEIIEAARKQADAAQERARALEVRRDELLAELETVRSRIHAMEADIEERRKPVPADPAQPASVRLIPAEGSGEREVRESETKWSPTDTIRIIPAAGRKIEPDEPVDAAALADEVRRLRDEAALAELAGEPDEAVAEEPGEELSVEEDETPVAEPAGISEAAAEPDNEVSSLEQPEAVDEAVEEVQEKPWALDSLFATLRSEPPEAAPMAAPEYPQESVIDAAPRSEPAADANAAKLASPPDGDAIADRDRLLLPITNRVLRSVKRQLTEAQNIALEDVRVNETWNPESVDLAERVRGDLLVLVQESYAAGQSAAGSILGVETGRAKPGKADIPDHSGEFSSTMTEALASVAGSAGEQGPRALSASLSRVYRAWRTDEAERRLRGYAAGAFHRGVLAGAAGAAGAGATQIAWVMSGRGCTTCRAADQVGTVAIGSDFPGIDGVPPVHPGCACTIVPM